MINLLSPVMVYGSAVGGTGAAQLTEEEQASLADLIDAVEMANAQRWQALAALAGLRGLSLAEIARDLEIPLFDIVTEKPMP